MNQESFLTIVLKKKWLIIIALVVILVIIGGIIFVNNVLRNSYLNIYVAPSKAKIIINGAEYRNGTHRIFPGEYTVKISADGFEEKTINVIAEANQYTNLFSFLNGDDTNRLYYEYKSNSNDYAILEQVARYNSDANEIVSSIEAAKGIEAKLPKAFEGENKYSIEKSDECRRILCLRVRNFRGNNYESAIEEIKKMGFEPSRYEILNVDGRGERI